MSNDYSNDSDGGYVSDGCEDPELGQLSPSYDPLLDNRQWRDIVIRVPQPSLFGNKKTIGYSFIRGQVPDGNADGLSDMEIQTIDEVRIGNYKNDIILFSFSHTDTRSATAKEK